MDTKIHSSIWANPAFIEMSDSEKLSLFWVLTNVNTCGYVALSQKRLARDIDVDVETVHGAVNSFFSDECICGDSGIWLSQYTGKQMGKGEKLRRNKMLKTVLKHLEDAPENIQEAMRKEYPEAFKSADLGVQNGDAMGDSKGEREGGREGVSEEEVIRRNEKDTEMVKEMEITKEMELEAAKANSTPPSASCYYDDDDPSFG